MIIGISGKIGAGKDTIGAMIRGTSPHHWEIKKFGYKLKQIATILTGIPVERFEDQEFKKTLLGKEWSSMSVREFLQKLGTDAVRMGLHKETWVNALFADYNPEGYWPEEAWTDRVPNWLITDVRFPNEAKAVKDRGGIVVRVTRPLTQNSDHPSETALDTWPFDHVFDNSGDMAGLYEQVRQFIKERKL